MTFQVLHVEAFSSQPGMGNPAGVVLSAEHLRESEMQAIAHAVGFNETAFVLPSEHADVRLRYFTPGHEVDLCGHATVASLIALHEHGRLPGAGTVRSLTFEARAGVLPVTVEVAPGVEPRVVMAQAPARFEAFGGDRTALARAIGIEAGDLHPELPILYGSTGLWTLVVPVRDLAAIRRMRPRNPEFPHVLAEMPAASVHPFCLETLDSGAHMHARHFSSPRSGTIEDAVTGTASGVLGAYYREFVQAARDEDELLVVEQGQEIGRDGRVHVWAVKKEGRYNVRIAGTGCVVGDLPIDLSLARDSNSTTVLADG